LVIVDTGNAEWVDLNELAPFNSEALEEGEWSSLVVLDAMGLVLEWPLNADSFNPGELVCDEEGELNGDTV
jgi:hypothetical protein